MTRQFSPSANAAVAGEGDGDGFETTPTNAYADDTNYAVDTNSGANDNSDPTGIGTDKHNYYDYSLDIMPTGSTINGITVRADIAVDSTNNSPSTAIRLSWDGGTSWTVVKQQTLTATAETTYTYGGPADDWGHTPWTLSELSNANFRLQVINGDTKAQNSLRDFSLDWIPVSITFTAPWESYKTSARTEVWGDDAGTQYNSEFHFAYMKGTGFATGSYNVGYYDTDGTYVTEENVSANGTLNGTIDLMNDPLAAGDGWWHALVQPAGCANGLPSIGTPTAYDEAINNSDFHCLLANDSFYVAAEAIPEFTTVLAGIVVAALCFAIYYWMRKRQPAYVKA